LAHPLHQTFFVSWLLQYLRKLFSTMRTLLLVLACLAHHAHARIVQKTMDDQDKMRALATLLFTVNPSLGMDSSRGGHRRLGRPLRKEDARRLRSVDNPLLAMKPSKSRGVLGTTGAGDLERKPVAFQTEQTSEAHESVVSSQQLRGGASGKGMGGKPDSILVQGGSLKTWSYRSSVVERVQVVLTTDGRPLDADVQLWEGPDNTPCKMRVYCEDGSTRPFRAIIETPGSGLNTVAVYNVGQIEFPLAAYVIANDVDEPVSSFRDTSMIVQGGALRTYPFDASVESVEIMLKTDGRPLNARIELLQGPNNIKQIIELRNEDGLDRPFFAILDTMPWHGIGSGNAVRIVNTAPIEFPMTVSVQPHSNKKILTIDHVIGGGISVY